MVGAASRTGLYLVEIGGAHFRDAGLIAGRDDVPRVQVAEIARPNRRFAADIDAFCPTWTRKWADLGSLGLRTDGNERMAVGGFGHLVAGDALDGRWTLV